MDNKSPQKIHPNLPSVSFLSLGGMEDVTRNMYLYEYKDQILIVDCGLGFPDETMLGVDLLLPDISYLLTTKKKIIGMVLTHGHEDHIGGLPFILPQLPKFPIYASPFTAALTNEKLSEYKLSQRVKTVKFTDNDIKLGDFTISFVRVTHSVPDSANIIIKTPVGNLFHGSDFKFDLTPADGMRTDFIKIMKAADEGILCLMSDCLGSDRSGFTASEESLGANFEREMRESQGKCIVTSYSSNVSRMNQVILAAEKTNRKVCFVGRSVIKVKDVASRLGYIHMRAGTEVELTSLKNYKSNQLVFIVAGSQGQENSAMTRIAHGTHKDVKLDNADVVIFSADPIPGNEIAINALVDTIVKKGAKVVHSTNTGGLFHVSGHGSSGEHMLLIALTKPKFLLPISGTYRHMVAYKSLAEKMGYKKNEIFLVENGKEVILSRTSARFGRKIEIKNVYVDQVSGEEIENFVIRDREKLAKEGVVIVMAEVKSSDGQLVGNAEIVIRGSTLVDVKDLINAITQELQKNLSLHKEKVTNWIHMRRMIGDITEKYFYKKFKTRPLVLPVIVEV